MQLEEPQHVTAVKNEVITDTQDEAFQDR